MASVSLTIPHPTDNIDSTLPKLRARLCSLRELVDEFSTRALIGAFGGRAQTGDVKQAQQGETG
jgi:hypothetical protein